MKTQYRIKTTRPHDDEYGATDEYGDTKGRPNIIDYSPWLNVPTEEELKFHDDNKRQDAGVFLSDYTPANTPGTATEVEWRIV
jgi:hypothetical protein